MKNIFNIRKNPRMRGFNYRSPRKYFITTNVKYNFFTFCEIIDGKIKLNQYGEIVQRQWDWLMNHYPYLKSHAFVIMPDHIHAVIEILHKGFSDEFIKIKSLSEVIGAFKTRVSKEIHLTGAWDFSWQRSFHDEVIDSNAEFDAYVRYVNNNPKDWMNKTLRKGD